MAIPPFQRGTALCTQGQAVGKTVTDLLLHLRKLLSEVKQQLCVLVPGWVTATVRVALLIDHSDIAKCLKLVRA